MKKILYTILGLAVLIPSVVFGVTSAGWKTTDGTTITPIPISGGNPLIVGSGALFTDTNFPSTGTGLSIGYSTGGDIGIIQVLDNGFSVFKPLYINALETVFQTENTEVMHLKGSNLGIGVSNPTSRLYVAGDGHFRGLDSVSTTTLTVEGASVQSSNLTDWIDSVGTVLASVSPTGEISSSNFVASSSIATSTFAGSVGIGTTSPYKKLSVGGDIVVGASTAGGTIGDLFLPKLGTAAGSFIAVDATGKVIATTTPASGGSGTVGSGTTGQVPYYAGSGTTLTATSSIFVSNTTGMVGINNTSPGSLLTIGQNATVSDTGRMILSPTVQGGLEVYSNSVIPVIQVGTGVTRALQFYYSNNTGYFGSFGNIDPIEFAGSTLTLAPITMPISTRGTLAAGSPGVEDNFKLSRPVNSGVAWPQEVAFAVGTWQTNNVSNNNGPATRFDIKLKSTPSTYLTSTTFLDNGTVGIGTTSPFSALSVSTTTQGTGSVPLFTVASTTNATLLTTLGNGNVGIGTTSPVKLLDIFSIGTSTVRIDTNSTTKGSCLVMKDSDGVGYTYITANNGVLTASTVSCE